MNKHQRRLILEILQTTKEAQTHKLFEDCKNASLSIIHFIENTEGKDTQSVKYLEEYYNLLCRMSNEEVSNEKFQEQIEKIENSIKSEFTSKRIEIVFLSYKASMSDSIESIYLEAKENPYCDAYWIPIPYYDRNADGTLGEMHYEGAEYYDERFEITNWEDYNIEMRCPDIIFTFAPYDDLNLVTMVHPNFHCKHLRNFTDLLCYVPYFVHEEDNNVDHYPLLNGVLHSNLVFVQSLKIREKYINVIQNSLSTKDESYENKIIGLGSPKFDKVITSRESNYPIKDEWKKIIGDKKVILYNTTIGTFLRNPYQYIQKLRNVFEFFKSCKSAVMIWRPHPLLEQSILSMHPELYIDWNKLVNFYISRQCGIFDDNSDIYQAINISDAYYGDSPSSVETLYRVTSKPILIQDMNCKVYSDFECSYLDLSSSVFLESNNEIRIADFIEKLDEISSKNTDRQQKLLHTYTNIDGTAGKKIFDYVLSEIKNK